MTGIFTIERDGVATITLPDPRIQGLGRTDLDDFAAAVERVQSIAAVGCILLRGVPGVFSEGVELDAFAQAGDHDLLQSALSRCFKALALNELPIVAAVEGRAVGLGMSILCHVDAAVAASTSEFGAPFVSLGLVPEAGSTLLLRERMGYLQAVRLFCLGETVSAEEALRLGIVSEVVAGNLVQARALELATLFARRRSDALTVTRRLLRHDTQEMVRRIEAELSASRDLLDKPTTVKRLARIASMTRRNAQRTPVAHPAWQHQTVLAS